MRIKLNVEEEVLHFISCYTSQTECSRNENETFLEEMDSEMQAVIGSEKVVVAGDLNGDVGTDGAGYNNVGAYTNDTD